MSEKILLSFVIPCYGSEQTIQSVIEEIKNKVSENKDYDYEIVAVNDQSPDQVLEILKMIAKQDSKFVVIDLAKNMGKHAALMAGYAQCNGEIIISVDDDGQCPIECLWDLLKPLEEGYDISVAGYRVKKQSRFKNFGSAVNEWMVRILLDKPKELKLSNFLAFKHFICEEILRYKNPYPYIDGLYLRTTRKIKNVFMEERERQGGVSGFTLKKSLSLWLNGFTAFSVKPLRITTIMGLFLAVVGLILAAFVVVKKLLIQDIAIGYSSIMATQLLIGGCILFSLGIIGEYIGRIYISLNSSPQYVIRQIFHYKNKEEEKDE